MEAELEFLPGKSNTVIKVVLSNGMTEYMVFLGPPKKISEGWTYELREATEEEKKNILCKI